MRLIDRLSYNFSSNSAHLLLRLLLGLLRLVPLLILLVQEVDLVVFLVPYADSFVGPRADDDFVC